MKKNFILALGLIAGLSFASCSDDKSGGVDEKVSNGDAFACIEQIIDGCSDIATEVGESKIGDPLSKYLAGNEHEALLAVESWYSFHSREDYSNNIYSIRNSYYGSRDGSISSKSLSALIAKYNSSLDEEVKDAISDAAKAILDIPNPFRNNINSTEAKTAQEKCADLVDVLAKLKTYMDGNGNVNQDDVLDPIIENYVDVVVLPTYKDLRDQNANLYKVVSAFQANPSNTNFQAVANAWLEARQPWETSEAFLFGPVDAEGLDPNMDSWPLDASQIATILNSGNFDDLDWTSGDDDETIEAKQGVRGFHTLEFLAFRNGKARTLSDVVAESEKDKDGNVLDEYLVYTSENANSWGNYMKQVAYLLQKDASDLYKYWSESYNNGDSYAKRFKDHNL